MRIAFIYFGNKKILEELIAGLSSVLLSSGHELRVIKVVKEIGESNLLPYNFIFIGCPVISIFKGQLPSELVHYIHKCTGLERKKSIVLVVPRLMGNQKTLKNLMKLLESKGSLVVDFQEIKNVPRAIELLASRIK